MKSIQCADIVVVADSDHGLVLAARLLKMDVAQVTTVAGLDGARGMCQKGGIDACIVAFDEVLPDAVPMVENDAPGRKCGVPPLMVVPTVSPYLRKSARRIWLYGGCSRDHRISYALPTHRRGAAIAASGQSQAAHARWHRCAGRRALAAGRKRQTHAALTALFSKP